MRRAWIALSSSLWFIPSTLVGASLILAVGLVELSARVDAAALSTMPRLFGAGAAGARGMLSTIAGSVITVAGVTFSITIAALAMASAQYTPRVLRTFMADRANQFVLGTFVGVYAYCLVVLRTIRGGDEGAFVPTLAVLGGFVLALISVGVLIFFVHHIADALQASTILDRVRAATEAAIDHLFPADVARPVARSPALPESAGEWAALPAPRTGYVQMVDADRLVDDARALGVTLRMERGVGDFVVAGSPLVSFLPDAAGPLAAGPEEMLRNRVPSRFAIASYRTVEQDPGFGILQIVDIAIKALSPGVNDTTTAVSCVDHLGALLARLGAREIPTPARGEATPRLIARGPTFDSLAALALADVRRNAAGNVRVLLRLYDAVETAGSRTTDARRRAALAGHVEEVDAVARRSVPGGPDLEHLTRRGHELRLRLREPHSGRATVSS